MRKLSMTLQELFERYIEQAYPSKEEDAHIPRRRPDRATTSFWPRYELLTFAGIPRVGTQDYIAIGKRRFGKIV